MDVFVVTAEQAAARDRAAVDSGTESKQLMRRAGERAAHCVFSRFPRSRTHGVVIYTGPGNNGGDGWIVAAECAAKGIPFFVRAITEPRTSDARWARSLVAGASGELHSPAVVVDALLGTGGAGPPRDDISAALQEIAALRRAGAAVVSLDVPSGLDATSGAAAGSVEADLTISFGTVKRGLLLRRDLTGEIVVCDIGLGAHSSLGDGAPLLVDAPWVRARLPRIDARAHKGTRRRLLLVGASPGIAGATILAARAALRSGVGMVRCCAHELSVAPLQCAVPEATVVSWPALDADIGEELRTWTHALLVGPGLGLADARRRVEQWLRWWAGPTVLDADALTAFTEEPESLRDLLAQRPAIITPHAVEAARLLGRGAADVADDAFDAARALCQRTGATVLLKGVPTIVCSPEGTSMVSARGTPVLATGGSGDVLAGIVTTLLAHSEAPLHAAAIGAFVHGRAAELANAGRPVRGVAIADVLSCLAEAWRVDDDVLQDGEMARLPRVGDA